jgi:hypothetical protein
METQSFSNSMQLAPQPATQPPGRNRIRRSLFFSFTLLLGIVIGAIAVLLVESAISGDGQILATAQPPSSSDIIVQAGITYVTHLVDKELRASGMLTPSNVQVMMASGDQITISGDDEIIFGVTRHFSIVVQPLIRACQLQMQVIRASLAGIPVTGLVANFQGRINQELQAKPGGLPAGFEYCKTSVRTDPKDGLFITYSAKPV